MTVKQICIKKMFYKSYLQQLWIPKVMFILLQKLEYNNCYYLL